MMNNKGQVTLFVIIGIIIVAIAGSLYYFIPRLNTLQPNDPPSINLQRCVDESFANAIFEVGSRGGYCEIGGSFATLSPAGQGYFPYSQDVCYGLRKVPTGFAGINLQMPTSFGSIVVSNMNTFRTQIAELTLNEIKKCTEDDNIRGNPVVVLGDLYSEVRVEGRVGTNERFVNVVSRLDIPFREMYRFMQFELRKSSNELEHSFIERTPTSNTFKASYYGPINDEKDSIFFVSTVNNPLPLEEARRNFHIAVIIENRYPVIPNPTASCGVLNLIDPDEFEKYTYGLDKNNCFDIDLVRTVKITGLNPEISVELPEVSS